MPVSKYSLWLMPLGAINQKFSQLIAQLAEQYSSPTFPPHVTLIGSIQADEQEITSKAEEVASKIRPFVMKLTDVDYTNSYYRALFVKVKPSANLLAAYQVARNILLDDQETSYMPHLSLLYADFAPEKKKQIVEHIDNRFMDEFEVDTLYLYLTEGAVGDWRKIGAFPLQR